MGKPGALALGLLLLLACGAVDQRETGDPFPPLFPDARPFLTAINKARVAPLSAQITGVTVPHHLLAADLVAAAFARVSTQGYRRIIILSPDHFSRSRTPFAVSRRNFQTPLGPLSVDQIAVDRLLTNNSVSVSNLFSHEHGVQALLPFLAYHFSQARVVALALRTSATPADWDRLAQTLAPLLTPGTLLLQSTDFSHYLSLAEARRRDQETLRVLSGGDPEGVKTLVEPQHLDSQAAQYLQLRLQSLLFRARPTVMAHRNSQEYTSEALTRTTSYLVQLYSPEPLVPEGVERYFFAGDTFAGRYLARHLADGEKREELAGKVLRVTGGAPLIVNLEGVVQAKPAESPGPLQLSMAAGLVLPLFQRLHVRAVSLANNHSRDFGEEAYRDMERILEASGLTLLRNGAVIDLGAFRLAAFTDLDNQSPQKAGLLCATDLRSLDGLPRDKPLFAFLHWGREYAKEPGPLEQALASLLEQKGVELIIGSHPHRAGDLVCSPRTCLAYSLGNFIFDQSRPQVSGALLEVMFFPQGTYFLRLHHLGNLYAGLSQAQP
jgi:poly-gamma-glutamate synthesis protein (capsule biosynthesis protein)